MKVSIIIVNYYSDDEIIVSIESLFASKTRNSYEVIVVDNGSNNLQNKLHKKYPGVVYVKNKNTGFGSANNIGVKYSNGELLFFLNPDTIIFPRTIDALVDFIEKRKGAGVVAPILLDKDKKPYNLQGTSRLGIMEGLIALSFFSKLFPKNYIYKKYWLSSWNRKSVREVDVVPGSAFMIRKKIFNELGGFDTNFFLFFEEHDLCLRVKYAGYKIYMVPQSQVQHFWGVSTKKSKLNLENIYYSSQFYYFKKHYGLMPAVVIDFVTKFNMYVLLLSLILLFSLFLRIYRLSEFMPFIGDQAWFYLSARDSIQSNTIPLVGITSSHTWLHQGPLWTYILMIIFTITKYNPIAPAYFTTFFGTLTTCLMYIIGKNIFSKKVGIIAASLFAFSPLAIFYSRMPYHTTLIPFFTALFILFFYKLISGNIKYLPAVFLLLGILYNFELASVLFVYLFFIFFLFGKLSHSTWVTNIKPKDFLISLFFLFIPLLPIIVYDLQNGFPQTLKFAVWNFVQLAKILGIHFKQSEVPPTSIQDVTSFFFFQYRRLVFLPNLYFSVLLFFAGIVGSGYILIYRIKNKLSTKSYLFVLFSTIILLLGFFAAKTRSEAYLPMLFPFLILLLAIPLNFVMEYRKLRIIAAVFILFILVSNAILLTQKNYFTFKAENPEGFIYGPGIQILTEQSSKIVLDADNKSFNLIGGDFLRNGSAMDNYEYLVWYLGGKISILSKISYIVYPEHLAPREKNVLYSDEYIKVVKKANVK